MSPTQLTGISRVGEIPLVTVAIPGFQLSGLIGATSSIAGNSLEQINTRALPDRRASPCASFNSLENIRKKDFTTLLQPMVQSADGSGSPWLILCDS
jgi:hypothetical protein